MQKKILVVDDSPTVVKFVSFSLKSRGFDVITACDGMDAMEKVSQTQNAADLVITDLNMPNMDGYSLISSLRKNREYANTPILILSSEEAEEDKAKGMEVGATAYLVKPFKAATLLAEVDKFLAK